METRHEGGCGCRFCNRMKAKTMPLEQWEEHHKDHCNCGDHFKTEPFEHPSGLWFWIVCPCGAKYLTTNEQ